MEFFVLLPVLIVFGIIAVIFGLLCVRTCFSEGNTKGSQPVGNRRTTTDDGFTGWQSSGGFNHGLDSSTTFSHDTPSFSGGCDNSWGGGGCDSGGGFSGGCDSGGGGGDSGGGCSSTD